MELLFVYIRSYSGQNQIATLGENGGR